MAAVKAAAVSTAVLGTAEDDRTLTLVGGANISYAGVADGVRLVVVASVGGYGVWEQAWWQALPGLECLIHHGPLLQATMGACSAGAQKHTEGAGVYPAMLHGQQDALGAEAGQRCLGHLKQLQAVDCSLLAPSTHTHTR